jgi:hypothetical protein
MTQAAIIDCIYDSWKKNSIWNPKPTTPVDDVTTETKIKIEIPMDVTDWKEVPQKLTEKELQKLKKKRKMPTEAREREVSTEGTTIKASTVPPTLRKSL